MAIASLNSGSDYQFVTAEDDSVVYGKPLPGEENDGAFIEVARNFSTSITMIMINESFSELKSN